MSLKRFRLSYSYTPTLSGLDLVSDYDVVADAIAAADTLALNCRFEGDPVKLIVVVDAWSGRVAYRTHA